MVKEKVLEIGDVRRFSSASKLAQFAAIVPLKVSSANSEKTEKRQEGKKIQAIIYFLAIWMINVSFKEVPKNPAFRDYYERRLSEGKSKKQVLICISRRLINISNGMLKSQTEYRCSS